MIPTVMAVFARGQPAHVRVKLVDGPAVLMTPDAADELAKVLADHAARARKAPEHADSVVSTSLMNDFEAA